MTLYLVTDNTDPASPSLTQLVPAIRDRAVAREFASFPQALAERPASRDVGATVTRLRARGAAPLDLAAYRVTTGPTAQPLPLRSIRPSGETMRRIEGAGVGIAAMIIAMLFLRVALGL